MAHTKINTQVIPDGTIVSADLTMPITGFSSTGIDDNATSNALTIDSSGNIAVTGTVDGRDLATDGTKLDAIEASADVTDTANVTSAGAVMDSEVTNLAQVKSFASSDYATAAQGTTADSALQNIVEDTSPQLGGNLDFNGNTATSFTSIGIDDNATSTAITIDSSENVGIGATVPSAFFAGATNLVVGGGVGDEGITVYSGATGSGRLHFADGTSGTAEYDGYVVYDHNNQKMLLGSSGSTRATIDSSGNVGIGTITPVNSANFSTLDIRSTDGAQVLLGRSSQFDLYLYTNSTESTIGTNVGQHLRFLTNSTGNSNEAMRITSDGVVGINTTTPSSFNKLHVEGGIYTGARGTIHSHYDGAVRWVKIFERHYLSSSFNYGQHNILVMQSGSTNGHGSAAKIHVTSKQQGTSDLFDVQYVECSGEYYTEVAYLYDATGGDNSEGILTIWAKTPAQYMQMAVTSDTSGSLGSDKSGNIMAVNTSSSTQPAGSTLLTPNLRLETAGNVGIGTTNPASPLHIQSPTNRTLTLDGTFATGSYTWLSVKRSTTEKWRWFLESDDDVTLYGDVNSVGGLMRWSSDGQVYINRSSSISGGTSSKLCISGNLDIDGNPGSTNVIRLYQSASEMGQLYAHTTGVRSYLFTGNVFSIKGQADATLKLEPGSTAADPVLQFAGQAGSMSAEGFEIWYDNNVGDAHLHTTYNNDAAAIRFHTKTGGTKVESNERFTIAGNGNIGVGSSVPQHNLDIGGTTPTLLLKDDIVTQANGNTLGRILFYNNESSTAGGARVTGAIKQIATDTFGRTALVFGTHTTDTKAAFGDPGTYTDSTVERLRIDAFGKITQNNTPSGGTVFDVDHSSFDGRSAAFPGRFVIGPTGSQYPNIGYNFLPNASSTYTKISGDTSYKINFGNGGKFTFSSSAAGTSGGTITWTDVMSITNGAFVGIGSNATSPVVPLYVYAQQNNYSPIAARSGNYTTTFGVLPWSVGNTYLSSGVDYRNGVWTNTSPGTYSCLFDIGGSSGIRWYASSNSNSTWDLASNVQLFNSSGQLTASSASDERLKENIVDYTIADALTKVTSLRPVSFEWNDTIKRKKGTEYADGTHIGFIAQEVEAVFPHACLISDTDEYDAESAFDLDPDDIYYGDIKGVRAEKMVPILVGAIKELTRRLEILENS